MAATGPQNDRDAATRLGRQLAFYRRLSLLLLLAGAVACGFLLRGWLREHALAFGLVQVDRRAPYAEQVTRLIQPLRYSITPILGRDDVRIDLDFDNKKWFLRNVHRFDAEGRTVLEDGRYGVCGALSAYAYDHLKTMLGPQLDIAFIHVAQSGFFPAYITEHVALEITDRSSAPPREWILDPSLKRYGPKDQFEDYLIFELVPTLPFMERHETDQAFRVGAGTPVEITGRYLVVLAVERQGGVFDRDNFRLSLVATHGYRYLSRPLLLLSKVSGRKDVLEYPRNIRRVLDAKTYGLLRERLLKRFDEL